MAENIIKILSDEKLKRTMGANSLKLIKQHSMDFVTHQFEKTFEKVINIYNKRM